MFDLIHVVLQLIDSNPWARHREEQTKGVQGGTSAENPTVALIFWGKSKRKNMSDFEALLNLHVNKQTLSKKRKARSGVLCDNRCTNRLLCPYSHGDKLDDLEHCLCSAWWCAKSHPNRNSNALDEPYNEACNNETPKPPKGYVCRRCKSTEHYLNKCPQNVCSYCQDIGHIASSCPHNLKRWQILERNVKAYRSRE